MTIRAVILGGVLALFIACATYFNDFVMKQTLLIGSFLPVSVFGLLVVMVIGVNPLLHRAGWPLRPAEFAVIAAMALAACAFPGANFCRYFTTMAAMPAHHVQRRPAWQAHGVMSYLPGGSHRLAPGQVRDWDGLAAAVRVAHEAGDPMGELYALAPPDERRLWDAAATTPPVSPSLALQLTGAINRVMVSEAFVGEPGLADEARERAGRAKLMALAPQWIIPPPRGEHVLVTGDRLRSEVTGPLVTGAADDGLIALDRVPWRTWWPTIGLWAGSALLLGGAALCFAVIVHPQWSQRELLAYPIARFLAELTRLGEGGGLPAVARSRLFWLGVSLPVVIHLLNGLHVWFPEVPQIQLRFDLGPLRTLFPNAARSAQSGYVFTPTIILTAVAFAWFLDRQVSLTIGISTYIFVAVGGFFIANGYAMEYDKFTPNKMNMIRFGAFVGLALMILYTGRQYYADVVRGGLGLGTHHTTPRSAVWAMRLGAGFTAAAMGLLWTSGMSPVMTLLLVGTLGLIWIGMTRIVCETGMFLMAGPFLPLGIWPGLIGEEAMGPTQIILMGVAGFILVGDPKEALMPFVATGLKAADRDGVRPGRVAPLLGVAAAGAMAVSLAVTLGLQYQHGANTSDGYAYEAMPSRPFADAARYAASALTVGELAPTVDGYDGDGDLGRLRRLAGEPTAWAWMGLGLVLVVTVAVARLRLPWWPIHPLLFLVWGTWGVGNLAFSFLLGWLLKTSVVRTGGLRMASSLAPLMIGVIAGELVAALGWQITGAWYYFATGLPPERYVIFP